VFRAVPIKHVRAWPLPLLTVCNVTVLQTKSATAARMGASAKSPMSAGRLEWVISASWELVVVGAGDGGDQPKHLELAGR
jgi:hypothetical protein